MISFLSHRIAHLLYQEKIIESEMISVCQYGFEIAISTCIGFFLVLMTGLVLGFFKEAILFYVLFIVIRFYTGGYHAETHFRCKLTLLTCSLFVLWGCVLLKPIYCIEINTVLETFYIIVVFIFTPVEHLNAPMTECEERKNRMISIAMAIVLFLVTTIMCCFKIHTTIIITLTQFVVAILVIISKLQKGGKMDEKAQRKNS